MLCCHVTGIDIDSIWERDNESDVEESLPASVRELARYGSARTPSNRPPGPEGVPLVSLGTACATKMAFDKIGRGAQSLPFDWITTRAEAVIGFLSNDFDGFLNFDNMIEEDVSGARITCFRSKTHSFWHDDLRNQDTSAKYTRRIDRLFDIDARTQPVLFVRVASKSDEISLAEEFVDTLVAIFGAHAKLLLIIDGQGPNAIGPAVVSGMSNLMLYYIFGASAGCDKYCQPIQHGLQWAANMPTNARELPSLQNAQSIAKYAVIGEYGMGGIAAFEGVKDL